MRKNAQITPGQIQEMRELFRQGLSTPMIAFLTHHTRATVKRYRDKYCVRTPCPCGKPATHKGWCKFRFALSPVRQKLMSKMRKIQERRWYA